MVKKKAVKKAVKETKEKSVKKGNKTQKLTKEIIEKVSKHLIKEQEKEEQKRLKEIEKKRDSLINEIKPRLMSNGALKRGGSDARAKYSQEQANYLPVIQEINDLGSELGLRQIGLGNLRG